MPIVQAALRGDRPVNDELFAVVLGNVTDMYMDAEGDADLQNMFGEPSRVQARYDELDRKRQDIEEASELDTVHAQLGALRGLGAITTLVVVPAAFLLRNPPQGDVAVGRGWAHAHELAQRGRPNVPPPPRSVTFTRPDPVMSASDQCPWP